MKTETFTPTFAAALLENVLVFIGMIVGVPVAMLSRGGSHPGMTVAYGVKWGLVGGIIAFLYYTMSFILRVPRTVVVSDDRLLLRWRNGTETPVRWEDVRRAVFRARWGYRWKFFLDGSAPILWGDGLSAATWEQISDLVVAHLSARNVPMEKYDAYGKRIA